VQISRRRFIATTLSAPSALSLSAASMLSLAACGDDSDSVDVGELMKPGPLPEKILGKADAPVTVVEYASLGCPHCADFEKEVFPRLKEAYIDTGKVRYVAREFPLDQVAAAAAMLARCAPEDKFFDMTSLFFQTQQMWHVSQNQTDALFSVVKQTGFTRDAFEACLKDQKLLDGVTAIQKRAADVFKVNATPTFFINGKKAAKFQTITDMDQTLAALLPR
jgi:protein-disulfide isomerase